VILQKQGVQIFLNPILFAICTSTFDRLCGLVARVLGYRSGGPGSIPGTTEKKVVRLEQGPVNLVSTTEELLDRKVAAPVYKIENTAVGIRHAENVAPFIPQKLAITSPTSGGRSVGIVRLRTQTMDFFYTSTFSKLCVTYTVTCRRVLSSTPL
jgi:hypothetical protein